MAKKRRVGAPEKVPGGLREVLYVRADKALLAGLDDLQAAKSKAGVAMSRADIARSLINQGMVKDMQELKRQERLSKISDTDRMEEGWTRTVLAENVTNYFASTEAQRLDVIHDLEQAVSQRRDIVSPSGAYGIEFRHKWPPAAREAILALWRTPKE